jgi:hypothetical protein
MAGPIRTTEQSVTVYDGKRAYEGYTLFAPHFGRDVWLIDMKGRIVHRWKMEHLAGGDGRLLPNGNLLRLNKTLKEPLHFLGSVSSELVEYGWEGKIVWRHDDPYMHHDFFRLENGNTLLNRHVLVPKEMVPRIKGGIPGTELKEGMWDNGFQEITPGGKVVWEWLGYEHQDPGIDVICPLCPRVIWNYANGLYPTAEGDIVQSCRHFNTLSMVDRKTGRIKWRWGSPYELGHHHNPTCLDNGNILVFDNGFHRQTSHEVSDENYSRVIEVNPKTNEIVWEYKDKNPQHFYSGICSSAERLPNGNTFICESSKGHLFEVTPEKEIVWEFFNPFYYEWGRVGLTNLVFKAHRYGVEFKGFQGKRLEPREFEWVLKDEPKTEGTGQKGREAVSRRLKQLGY